MSDRVVDEVSGSIWGSPGPSRKTVVETVEKEDDMIADRVEERKEECLKKIMGELEAWTETPGEEWTADYEDALIDMLNAVECTIKAQLSSNDPEYTG